MAVPPVTREFAEVPERFVQLPATSVTRSDDRRRCVVHGATWATVTAIRVERDELDELVHEVRGRVPPGRETLWHLGPSTSPTDALVELERRGLRRPTRRPAQLRALALTVEPAGPDHVQVRPVETFEQYAAARRIGWEAFGVPEERRDRELGLLRGEFDDMVASGIPAVFLASLDGRLAGSAVAVPSSRGVLLGGGSVASWARGRGLYRALVRARWDYAVERGVPTLVTHANPATSCPILRRLGFEEVGTIWRLEDPMP